MGLREDEDLGARALTGVRVLEVAEGIAGPFAAMRLAAMGADVIKVEPIRGDYYRQHGPAGDTEDAPGFEAINRNKKSLAVDSETPRGSEIVAELVAASDVVISASDATLKRPPGTAAKPDVWCSISVFGSDGPHSEAPGDELVVQAASDMMGSLGVAAEPPIRLGADVVATNTAVFATQAILAALIAQESARGLRDVEVSLLGTALHMRGMMWTSLGNPDDWGGFYHDTYTKPPETGYRTRDGLINFSLGSGTEEDFTALALELEMTVALSDPRFQLGGREAVGVGRFAHEVRGIWEAAFASWSTEAVIDLIHRHRGNAVPFTDHAALCDHPQVAVLGLVEEIPSGGSSMKRAVAMPWRVKDQAPLRLTSASPRLGAHTDEIVESLGRTKDEIRGLRASGVLG